MPQAETPKQVITSDSGWRAFARTLAESAPNALAQSDRARGGIRRLIRTGR